MRAKQMALGGVTAALAVVIMCMGGLIPLATYILPMICCVLLQLIMKSLGSRGGWAWFWAVCLLSLLLCPDKEAAAVYLFLGYYPLLKPAIDRRRCQILLKLILFNTATFALYTLLIHLFGLTAISAEFREMGLWLTAATLILGNVCFFLLDRVLTIFSIKQKPGA